MGSTSSSGSSTDAAGVRTLVAAAATFEAARRLDAPVAERRTLGLHGHSFLAAVRCAAPPDWAPFPGGEVAHLRSMLAERMALLDYRMLNDAIADPTDENLARWVRDGMQAAVPVQVGLRSAARQGVELDASGRAHHWRRYVFQSAHVLPNVPAGHKCGRMHGHGFEVVVHAQGDAAAGGIDHARLDAAWAPLHDQLDHACLNDLAGLENPTSEVLSSWLWTRLKVTLPGLSWVTVHETGSCGACFDGDHYRIWKEFKLDSAVRLQRAPEGSVQRRLHGHTFALRLHLSAPLDAVMGWTLDFGDVKELFKPIFKSLDHRPLHEIPDLADCDTPSIAQWILAKGRARLPELDRVDLHETPGCGAIVLADGATAALAV